MFCTSALVDRHIFYFLKGLLDICIYMYVCSCRFDGKVSKLLFCINFDE